ncbi:DUF5956 family protein [Microbacterium sp. E-13]|uniref:DUF5956 family protein n=1 Tax=Microbacterium sp. E-13 TaxID=3404048 RepID=UPI003CF04DC0
MPDVGFQQLIARLVAEVDPSLVATGPKPVHRRGREECIHPDGTTSVRYRELTRTERRDIVESANEYLRAAGVAEVPGGEDLFLALPRGVADMGELCSLLLQDIDERPTDHPSQMATALREAIPHRYR